MSNNKTVAISINQDKLLANLQFSFSNKTTLLGELMQNSRRAGATYVLLESVDETTLRITDDGKGIDDFQNLFSVAESGWDAETVKNERPFGMGFLSCLYQAEKIFIESNGSYIEGVTSEILAGGALTVHDIAEKDSSYTRVTLYNFKLSKEDVAAALKKLAEGFPIPVIYNGDNLETKNRLVIDTGYFVEVEGIGFIHARNMNPNFDRVSKERMVVYLQGLPVYDGRRWDYNNELDIVHLDSTLYHARMPDRDMLIDENVVLEKISQAINQIHLDRLMKLKAELSPEAFASQKITMYALSIQGGLDVICSQDVRLSNYFYSPIAEVQPSCYDEHDVVINDRTDASLSYEDVASGSVKLCMAEHICAWDEDSNCAPAWVFARNMKWAMIDGFGHTARENLLEKHWVAPLIHTLNKDNVKVEAHRTGKTGDIALDYWSCNVMLCESYTITYTAPDGIEHSCIIDYEPVLTTEGVLLVPEKAHNFGESAILQGASYVDNENFDDDAFNKDATALNLYVNMLRTGDEVSSLQTLLNSVYLGEYKDFVGHKYELTLDKHCRVVLAKLAA